MAKKAGWKPDTFGSWRIKRMSNEEPSGDRFHEPSTFGGTISITSNGKVTVYLNLNSGPQREFTLDNDTLGSCDHFFTALQNVYDIVGVTCETGGKRSAANPAALQLHFSRKAY